MPKSKRPDPLWIALAKAEGITVDQIGKHTEELLLTNAVDLDERPRRRKRYLKVFDKLLALRAIRPDQAAVIEQAIGGLLAHALSDRDREVRR